MDKPAVLSDAEVAQALERLPGWKAENGALSVTYKMPGSPGAIAFFAQIGALAEAVNHHPDVDWRYNTLFIRTTTHQVDGQLTARDVELAGSIVANARQFEAEAV